MQNQKNKHNKNNNQIKKDIIDKLQINKTCSFFNIECKRNIKIINKGYTEDKKIKKSLRENFLCLEINEENKSNLNLGFNKFIRYRCDCKKIKPYNQFNVTIDNKILKYMKEKNNNILDTYKKIKSKPNEPIYRFITICKQLDSPMIIGLGEVSVREISIKLDHIFGVPFIPASSLKGAFKHFIKEDYEYYKPINENMKNKLLELFGSEDNIGQLIFLDTYPRENVKFKNDIMTPHYPDYYSEKENQIKSPTDDQVINPISFLALTEATFEFNIIIYSNINSISENLLETIEDCFKEFLKHSALGAKKAVGYGTFKEVNNEK